MSEEEVKGPTPPEDGYLPMEPPEYTPDVWALRAKLAMAARGLGEDWRDDARTKALHILVREGVAAQYCLYEFAIPVLSGVVAAHAKLLDTVQGQKQVLSRLVGIADSLASTARGSSQLLIQAQREIAELREELRRTRDELDGLLTQVGEMT